MDNLTFKCYYGVMENIYNNDNQKGNGFKGEWMFVLPTESFREYVNHPMVSRLYLTDVGFFPHALNHYRERKDGIEEYIYIYCVDGSGIIELTDGNKYVLHANEAFCIPKFEGHRYYAQKDNPWSILWVHFKGSDAKYYPLDDKKIVHFSSQSTLTQMQQLFSQLLNVLKQDYTLENFIYISQTISMILSETYMRGNSPATSTLITQVIRYMYEHIDNELTLDNLSSYFEVSTSHLSNLFKKNTGHSPIEFFIELKMDKACKLLRSSDMYTYEVAAALGYHDQYYFSRLFKNVVGCSPKDYRKF